MTLTKEWLQQTISELENERDAIPGAVNEDAAMALAAMKLALASLTAEPVCYLNRFTGRTFTLEQQPGADKDMDVYVPLYTAPPAPVSVPEWTNEQCLEFLSIAFRHAEIKGDLQLDDIRLGVKMAKGCRAAMLQGAEPVSQHPDLTVWYGSMPETNGKANWTAILHRKGEGIQDGMTIDRSEYHDRVLYAADRVRYLIGEKADRPCILDYDADAHSGYVKPGNSPATPDGWVLVPVEPTENMIAAAMSCDDVLFDTEDDTMFRVQHGVIWSAMLAAAPQQEAE